MALAEKSVSKSVSIVLETDSTTKATENISLGPVNPTATLNNSSIWGIKNGIEPILDGTVTGVSKSEKSFLYEEE